MITDTRDQHSDTPEQDAIAGPESEQGREETDAAAEPLHHRLKLRCLGASDYDAIRGIMDLVYDRAGGAWKRAQFGAMLSRFAEGQFCIEDNGKVVAAALSLIVDYKRYGDFHTHKQITGDGYFTTHNSDGDSLYGVDIFVHPDYRGLRLGRRLYDARKELCRNLNLRRIIFGGRIPNYDKYSDRLTPQQYIERVKKREFYDPVLTFQLSNDFHVRRVITGYLPEDDESHAYAVISQWINIDHQSKEPALIGKPKRIVRVAAVQWQMRPASTMDDLRVQLRYFVSVVSDYGADFVLLPEYFNAALMAHFHSKNSADAVRQLAEFTESIRAYLETLAVQYNINIIAGSLPEFQDHTLRNICYLLRRDGTWDYQYKLHVTPAEEDHWAMTGGDELKMFDTDEGRIGILVCYDVQFPELTRLLSDKGLQILFVPYLTDTKSGYLRVKRCCQARAIENECYVVATGSTGSLPNLAYMDIHYSQSAIFTPSDFIFPHDAIKAEATPNTETTLLADLDLALLKELGQHGSVRNLRQRRLDLYHLGWCGPDAEPKQAEEPPERSSHP